MRPSVVVVAVALALTAWPLAGQSRGDYTSLPSITLPPVLDRVLRDYERAWRAGDAVELAALFTPDGFVPAGPGWVRGTAAIQSRYAGSSGNLQLRALAYAVADTVGYVVGAYGYGEEPGGPDRGKFVLALRRGAGGRWLIAADLDNGNTPE